MKRLGKLVLTIAVVMLGVGAAVGLASPIYEQRYVVEATITSKSDPYAAPIKVSEIWHTIVYRDLKRFHTVVRVFGEALYFEFNGEDYFALKRGSNNSSAGAYDPLRECFGIRSLSDYGNLGDLTSCEIVSRTPMIVRTDASGIVERLSPDPSTDPDRPFEIEYRITPTNSVPSYELARSFPWIADLQVSEPSGMPFTIPEEGIFANAKHYHKDFEVRP
ncbi:MAG: hypothetical protein JNL14_06500 [Devosia sp.]|uniref:hypothetical protein n=1 Tax=Devosia sp. TaxID=1871048 RepID=UPI001A4F2191|nr:hypothetical protein [Devosia sp.]MBL8597371.1 hypothetical protein [Devosia sp.]